MGRKTGKAVDRAIVKAIRRYLVVLPESGIHPTRAVLFGSFARDDARQWSDIDLTVIAPEFDKQRTTGKVKRLWRATLVCDVRIEPIPCGEKEWLTSQSRPILEIARQEGIIIAA